jgi:hypothetical protein
VKIRFGALDGHEAIYAGEADKRRKACVLVCLLGRQVMVKIAAGLLLTRPVTRAAPEAGRIEPKPEAAHPRWVRPIGDYEQRETTIVEGLRYG